MGLRGHFVPRALALRDPAPPEAGLGVGKGCWGGHMLGGGCRPPPSVPARVCLTKLHFEINSVAAGASEGYGCHGDGAERGSPGQRGLGQGVRAPPGSPRPACRGFRPPAQLSPGLCLLIPTFCIS